MSSRRKNLHYSGPNNGKSFSTSAPKSLWGGAVYIFGAKIGLKSIKNVLFCILFRPIGGCSPPASPLATLLFLLMPGYMVMKWQTIQPNQDPNQKCIVLNLLLQSRMPVVLARLRTGPQIDGKLCGINGKTA